MIAGGTGESVLGPIVAGEQRGTRFVAEEGTQPAFKLWLRFGTPVVGRLHVDEGARRAVREEGRSLLAVGVLACDGRFEAGDGVELVCDGVAFAKGLSAGSAAELAGPPPRGRGRAPRSPRSVLAKGKKPRMPIFRPVWVANR